MIFPLIFFTAISLVHFFNVILNLVQNPPRSKFAKCLFSYSVFCILLSVFLLELVLYLDNYYTHYPLDSYQAWQVGFRPAIHYTKENENQYDQIIITKSYGPSLLHFLFHNQFPPGEFHQIQKTIGKQGNLSPTPEHLGKYWFTTISPGDVTKPNNTLYLAAPWDQTQGWQQLDTITTPDGTDIFNILSSN
jgi:hypothetical protein